MARADMVEIELRQEIKEINEKLTNLQVSLKDEMSKIVTSLVVLKSRQNIGTWIFNTMITVIIAGVSGLLGSHLIK